MELSSHEEKLQSFLENTVEIYRRKYMEKSSGNAANGLQLSFVSKTRALLSSAQSTMNPRATRLLGFHPIYGISTI